MKSTLLPLYLYRRVMLVAGAALLAQPSLGQATQAGLTVRPAYAWLTQARPHGAVFLTNTGTAPVEVRLTLAYGVVESPPSDARATVQYGRAGLMGDISASFTYWPRAMVLQPGEQQWLRYAVNGAEHLPPGGHIALLQFRLRERIWPAPKMAVEFVLVSPVIVIVGDGHPVLSARLVAHTPTLASVLVENTSAWPFAGKMTLHSAETALPLGSAEVAVLTRRLVEIPLSGALPTGALEFTFAPTFPDLDPVLLRQVANHAPLAVLRPPAP